MTHCTIKIFNYLLGFLITLNIIAFFAFHTTIVFNIFSYYGSEISWKFFDLQFNYGVKIFPYTFGLMIMTAGIRFRISCSPSDVKNQNWKFLLSSILIAMPLVLAIISLLEHYGILSNSYIVF